MLEHLLHFLQDVSTKSENLDVVFPVREVAREVEGEGPDVVEVSEIVLEPSIHHRLEPSYDMQVGLGQEVEVVASRHQTL